MLLSVSSSQRVGCGSEFNSELPGKAFTFREKLTFRVTNLSFIYLVVAAM